MLIETNWSPSFRISIHADMVKALTKVARRHYDYACKSMADHELVRWLSLSENDFGVSASFRDLDLTLKICEMRALVCDEYEIVLLDRYVRIVRDALQKANTDYRAHNPERADD